jgi:THO complex subunit 1
MINFNICYIIKTILLFDSPELTKLWNLCPNNLEACKSKDRDFLPSLETYFEDAIMELDPAAMVDDKYKYILLFV